MHAETTGVGQRAYKCRGVGGRGSWREIINDLRMISEVTVGKKEKKTCRTAKTALEQVPEHEGTDTLQSIEKLKPPI